MAALSWGCGGTEQGENTGGEPGDDVPGTGGATPVPGEDGTGGEPNDGGNQNPSGGSNGDGGSEGSSGNNWIAFPMNRDTQGRFSNEVDTFEELLPAGGQYLGASSQASMIGVPGYRQFVLMVENVEGVHYSDLPSRSDVCPSGWAHLAGNFLWEVCGAMGNRSAVVISRNPAGLEHSSEDPGRLCPSDSTFVGRGAPMNISNGEVCEYPDERTYVHLTTNTELVNRQDLPSVGDVCPNGWDFVGSYYQYTVCVRSGPGAVVYIHTDADGRRYPDTLTNPSETCPMGWTWLGDLSGNRACFLSEHRGVAAVSSNPDGLSSGQVTMRSEMCAAEWTYVGHSTFSYCVR